MWGLQKVNHWLSIVWFQPSIDSLVYLQKFSKSLLTRKTGHIVNQLDSGRWAVVVLESGKRISEHSKNFAVFSPRNLEELEFAFKEESNLMEAKQSLIDEHGSNVYDAMGVSNDGILTCLLSSSADLDI